jgi:hypothetical protein
MLDHAGIEYFNPVVEDWTEEARKTEELEKIRAEVRLYTLTPKMTGMFSIAEIVDDSNKFPNKTICLSIENDDGEIYTAPQYKSIVSVFKLVEKNGVSVFRDMTSLVEFMKSWKVRPVRLGFRGW